jgi:hypothetical protein
MPTKKIFLASSSELKNERDQFEILINRKNKEWVDRGVFLDLGKWEDFLDAVSRTRLQDDYNKAIRESDIFVMLFLTKVGKYTEEEFDTALAQFKATGKPVIFTYFKDVQISTGSANQQDLMSLWAFQKKLKDLGHFQTVYKNTEGLLLHFTQQLEKLADSGFIEFGRDKDLPTAPAGITYQATNTGSGAIAQGGGNAFAERAVYVAGQNSGNINTGTQITGNVSGCGIAIGSGAQSSVTQGISPRDLEPLFAQLLAAVAREVPPERRADVVQRVAELKSEVARDKQADDGKIARILEGLVDLVPGAVASVVGTFATPLLGGVAGPLTKSLLNRLKLD